MEQLESLNNNLVLREMHETEVDYTVICRSCCGSETVSAAQEMLIRGNGDQLVFSGDNLSDV